MQEHKEAEYETLRDKAWEERSVDSSSDRMGWNLLMVQNHQSKSKTIVKNGTGTMCRSDRLAANCAILVTAYAISGLVPSIRYKSNPITCWYLVQSFLSTDDSFGTGLFIYWILLLSTAHRLHRSVHILTLGLIWPHIELSMKECSHERGEIYPYVGLLYILSTVMTVDIYMHTKWTFPKVKLLLHCVNCSVVDGHVCIAPGDLIAWVSVTSCSSGGYFDSLLSVHPSTWLLL